MIPSRSCALLCVAIAVAVSACSGGFDVASYLSPYRIDVRQGNMVTQEMVAQLKPGMSKEQVRFALGTPLLTDVFHAERWDYVYRFQPGHGEVQQRKLTVYFEGGKLARLAGDVTPAQAGELSEAAAPRAGRLIDIPPEQSGAAPAGEQK